MKVLGAAATALYSESDARNLRKSIREARLRHVHSKLVADSNMLYTIRGKLFSTVEFNRNIIFKAHEDGHNVDGTCVCITTLDRYAGGRLVFPRYGYSAELQPMDLLICDNDHELHGNLGPIIGDRYSVVAFLHERVMGRGGWAAD